MNPRFGTLLLTLILASLAAPAQASASWASIFAAPSCVTDSEVTYADPAVDTTSTTTAWQSGTAGTVSIPYSGTDGVAWQWSSSCGDTIVDAMPGEPASISGDGIYTFSHRAQDGGGLWTEWVDQVVQIDSAHPVNTTSPTADWVRGPLTVNVTGGDRSPIVLREWRVGAAGPFTTGAQATVPGITGTHELHTAVTDSVGLRTEASHSVQIDNTLPVDNTTVPVGWQHQLTNVTITGTDAHAGVDRVEWELDGIPGTGPNGKVLQIGHGDHVLKTKIVDEAGNESAFVTRSVQVDINGPTDTTAVPAGWVASGDEVDVTITGTDTAGSGIVRTEWKLTDLGSGLVRSGDVAGPGPVIITVSGDGVHRLETRLTDGLGDTSGWKIQNVRIDTVTPTDTTSPASGWLKQALLNVTVGGADAHSDIERVEWKLNGVAGSATGRSHVVQVDVDGVNTLETRVVDHAGNASEWKAHTIRLDTTLPLNLTASANSEWQNTPYSVTLAGDDAGSGLAFMRWRLGSGPVTEGTSGIVKATVSTTGVHTLYTWAVDKVGNPSAERAETVRIDLVKPNDATVYPGVPVPRGRKIVFAPADADSGVARFEWTLDGGAVQTAPSVTLVTAGPHTLASRVKDNAGNWSDWSSRVVTVDGSASEDTDPPVDTTSAPAEWQTGPYTLHITANDLVTGVKSVEWRVGGQLGSGPSGSTVEFTTEGRHEIETRAVDNVGLKSAWRTHVVKVDLTTPADTTSLPAGWTKSATATLSASDSASKVAKIEYKVNGGPTQTATLTSVPGDPDTVTATLPTVTSGKHTISHRAIDTSERASSWKDDAYWVDTELPAVSSAAAPVGWQTSTLSLPLTGTDTRSGVDHAEWRVDGGEIQTGATATVATEGIQTLETRVVDKAGNPSPWRTETVRIDRTKPVNTTPSVGAAWRKTNFATTVTGSDATPGSGVLRIEYKLDNGAVTTTPGVTVSAEGSHKLETRVLDVAGNASDWRTDLIGIDKTVPALVVDCGGDAWRATAAVCTVNADGGPSGLPTVTATRGTGAAEDVTGGSYTVDADGASSLSFRAADGAGNETLANAAVKIDRTPPAATVTCAPGAGLSYVCHAGGADGLSGLAALNWSVNGSPAAPLSGDGSFAVTKGTVVVTAVDAAGNAAASTPVTLADRTPPAPPAPEVEPITPRMTSDAVLLRRGGSASARLLGQLAISATPTGTTVDLRPLALGAGTFQFVIKVTTDKKSKTVRKTAKTTKGYSSRISVRAAAAAHVDVKLTVRRKSGKRWVTHAAGSASLE